MSEGRRWHIKWEANDQQPCLSKYLTSPPDSIHPWILSKADREAEEEIRISKILDSGSVPFRFFSKALDIENEECGFSEDDFLTKYDVTCDMLHHRNLYNDYSFTRIESGCSSSTVVAFDLRKPPSKLELLRKDASKRQMYCVKVLLGKDEIPQIAKYEIAFDKSHNRFFICGGENASGDFIPKIWEIRLADEYCFERSFQFNCKFLTSLPPVCKSLKDLKGCVSLFHGTLIAVAIHRSIWFWNSTSNWKEFEFHQVEFITGITEFQNCIIILAVTLSGSILFVFNPIAQYRILPKIVLKRKVFQDLIGIDHKLRIWATKPFLKKSSRFQIASIEFMMPSVLKSSSPYQLYENLSENSKAFSIFYKTNFIDKKLAILLEALLLYSSPNVALLVESEAAIWQLLLAADFFQLELLVFEIRRFMSSFLLSSTCTHAVKVIENLKEKIRTKEKEFQLSKFLLKEFNWILNL